MYVTTPCASGEVREGATPSPGGRQPRTERPSSVLRGVDDARPGGLPAAVLRGLRETVLREALERGAGRGIGAARSGNEMGWMMGGASERASSSARPPRQAGCQVT
ncbi:unnamed protein product [Pedinophyceae sp. YPF-701]|nr:unnamed protein product [Pedinophyceae sp. YPF-701]